MRVIDIVDKIIIAVFKWGFILILSIMITIFLMYKLFGEKIYNQAYFDLYDKYSSECDKYPNNPIYQIAEVMNSYSYKKNDVAGVTPLYLAMSNYCYKDMETMLRYGANPNQTIKKYNISIKDIAIKSKNKKGLELLIQYGDKDVKNHN